MTRLLSALALCSSALAADWPQAGRDHTRNPVSPEKGVPTRWHLGKSPAGVKWQARIGGRTIAAPTVAGSLVWVGTNNQTPRDPEVKGDHAVLMCFRESDGQFLWPYTSTRLPGNEEDMPHACLAAPLAEGDRLYFVTNRAEVVCLDIAPEPAKPLDRPVKPSGDRVPDTVFAPTPQPVVEAMLEAAKVKKTDVVVDLGCGDGRIVVTAARKYGCRAVGYDLDPECVRMAKERVAADKVAGLVTIEAKDLFTVPLGKVDVVALYLPPRMTERLVPRLEKLPAGHGCWRTRSPSTGWCRPASSR